MLTAIGPQAAIAYSRARPMTYQAELFEFLRIPSVSTQPAHEPDMQRAADWLHHMMEVAGLENVRVYPSVGKPIVYGDWLHAPGKPTVLFYGHYDVQPADDLELWDSPPFEPEIRKQNVYARGASDDKGQVMILLKAVEAYLQSNGALPVNVKFLLEGEEESGGKGLEAFIPENEALLSADIAFIADTAMADWDTPTIVYGLRGICQANIDVRTCKRDVHSGTYGGGINNPINALAHIIAQLQDRDGHVLIPGFYDNVRSFTDEERDMLAAFPLDEADFLTRIDARKTWGEPEYTLVERLGVRPTLDVNGIIGGYTGDGGKTIIPSRAHAKVSMRLVPDQHPERIAALFKSYVEQIAPDSVAVTVTILGKALASVSDYKIPAMKAAGQACDAVFGRGPVFKRGGGTLPIVAQLQQELALETIMLGFALPHDRIHAPNERFHLPNFYRGIETVIHFLAAYGALDGATA